MHPRNKHNSGYDLDKLIAIEPALKNFTYNRSDGIKSIDFTNPDAVKLLNKALLKSDYDIQVWDIPAQFLCPPVPGRADYIHALKDLLDESNLPDKVQGVDIGTGANLIYPILGSREYNWRFVASDINPLAVKCAKTIAELNKLPVKVMQQKQPNHFFKTIIKANQFYHFSMCNPPFHASEADANKGTRRKWKNLNRAPQASLNFGGQAQELWCEGGEKRFILDMISESVTFKEQVYWFTSLISNKDNIKPLKQQLKQFAAEQVKVIEMEQGNKTSRFIAWSFFKP
ncbi:23S rRNA (adenine(1618)-N(6))-methyltransferase RlmF [Pseudoalteromonas galatheae]|uniref:23S rRNA (adenine(1618)-N(6))-methyltransferase RlmF n=1 Tax=Pseudoalteromonas galatheae TaxID=579562 RepID=UPI0030CE194B